MVRPQTRCPEDCTRAGACDRGWSGWLRQGEGHTALLPWPDKRATGEQALLKQHSMPPKGPGPHTLRRPLHPAAILVCRPQATRAMVALSGSRRGIFASLAVMLALLLPLTAASRGYPYHKGQQSWVVVRFARLWAAIALLTLLALLAHAFPSGVWRGVRGEVKHVLCCVGGPCRAEAHVEAMWHGNPMSARLSALGGSRSGSKPPPSLPLAARAGEPS